MNTEEQLVEYVRTALQAKEAGEPVDIRTLCSEHPELVEPVEEALLLQDSFVEATQDSDDPLCDQILDDRYALQVCIGMGAMGAVYEAIDLSLKRKVAVKILQRGFFDSDERRKRFVREAQVLASLKHDHIVEIHDHGRTDNGLHYIVMERLQGVALSNLIESAAEAPRPRGLPGSDWRRDGASAGTDYIPQIASWIADLASGLRQAHDAGVFHRDVKPSNIFVTDTDRAVLLDFGIATRAEDGSLTTKGTTLGTPWYMAPEQAVSGQSANAKVDIYGLCATLYHLVAFRPPYEGESSDVLVRLRTEDPPPPTKVMPGLPRDLGAIIEKGMERNPDHRYANMAALEEDLRAFLAHLPVLARPITPAHRVIRRIRRRPTAAIVTGALLTGVVVTGLLTSKWKDDAAAEELEFQKLVATTPALLSLEGYPEHRLLEDLTERNEGIAHLDRILELRPDHLPTRLLRASMHLDAGERARSSADLAYIEDSDSSTPYLRAIARLYHDVEPGKRGIGAIDLSKLPEPQTDVDCFVAGFHVLRTRKSKNFAMAHDLLTRAESYIPARDLRTLTFLFIGGRARDPEQKRQILKKAQEEAMFLQGVYGRPTARTCHVIGTAYLRLRDYKSSISHIQEAIRLRPGRHGPLNNLGYAYMMLNRFEDAQRYLAAAHAIRPWLWNTTTNLAIVDCRMGRYEGALAKAETMPSKGEMGEVWRRPRLFGQIYMEWSLHHMREKDLAAAIPLSKKAASYFEQSLANGGPRSILGPDLAYANVASANGSEETLLRFLEAIRSNPADPTRIVDVAVLLPESPLMDALRIYLLRLASSLAPGDDMPERTAAALERSRASDAAARKPDNPKNHNK